MITSHPISRGWLWHEFSIIMCVHHMCANRGKWPNYPLLSARTGHLSTYQYRKTVQPVDLQGLGIKVHRKEVGQWEKGSPVKSQPPPTENHLLTEIQEKGLSSVLVWGVIISFFANKVFGLGWPLILFSWLFSHLQESIWLNGILWTKWQQNCSCVPAIWDSNSKHRKKTKIDIKINNNQTSFQKVEAKVT